ncbi:MAG: prolyl oligopeptidase family serine peptidase [Crocinitomicaceae bacterium]|nr:alpha/beta hydrolase-fold protein [Flavobacteriales bacterium]NQZ34959.1 prolyl oligopeptidase family serine peptidase [Crocinitomicaceae bacterium]
MIRSILFLAFLIFCLVTVQACTSKTETTKVNLSPARTTIAEEPPISLTPTLDHDTTVFFNFNDNPIEVTIKFPQETAYKGTIVALPGWNFPNSDWCDSTQLCEKALAQGYAIILPEMGKSIYCDSIFPETRKDWLKYPTRSWIKETMIPEIQQKFNLLAEDQDNFLIGLSTGARGAVLLALDLPLLFNACGALSGDFDQTRYTKDKLYNGFYGSFTKFTDRWLENDNAVTSIQQLTVPIYLGHGENDRIVPIEYSKQLFGELQKMGNTRSELKINPTAGHTYSFWNSEVDSVLAFFEKNSSK